MNSSIPTEHTDPINERILAVAEDKITGFTPKPFVAIAEQTGFDEETIVERLKAMHAAGVVRRLRQTMITTKLVDGALIAWHLPEEKLELAFDFLKKNDPFTGHVVLRIPDNESLPGAEYKLWTTLKVPQGQSVTRHADLLKKLIGAYDYVLLPALGVFALGVGHVRRRKLLPGDKGEPALMQSTELTPLSSLEWKVLLSLKNELTSDEFVSEPWAERAHALDMAPEDYYAVAHRLDELGVVGRFATFLEHSKPSAHGGHVTRHNGLFHWSVPKGMEERAGSEIGRHLCMTHCYWRGGGENFGGAQIMGVVHGLDRDTVMAHKAAIDKHLEEVGIPLLHSAVFWGTRAEIKPSELAPTHYEEWFENVSRCRLSIKN